MFYQPVKYDEPLFRPPGEARSAILQATIGCSWNKCAFCEMYTSKQFRTWPFDELEKEIAVLAKHYKGHVKKVFLGDGDVFVLSADKLYPIIDEINRQFGRLQRISTYASPKDILSKTDSELKKLKDSGLKLLYIGIESGDDELLKLINKGETFNSTKEGILKAHQAGIDTSVMILNGLGGKRYSRQHALHSAEIVNAVNPKFLSTLTLSLPYGPAHFKSRFGGEYIQQTVVEIMEELQLFIENIEAKNVIFRSNHVSNNLALAGTLSKDKAMLINAIEKAKTTTPEFMMPEMREML
jgi:radical SAM superfamily enzyme YgiQ (UPF0313 family)